MTYLHVASHPNLRHERNPLGTIAVQDAIEALGLVLVHATYSKYRLSGGDLPGDGVIILTVAELVEELELLGVDVPRAVTGAIGDG